MEEEIRIVYRPTESLKPYKNNPRDHGDGIDAVAASIEEFKFRSPIQIQSDGTIINGHTRYQAAKKLGIEQIPCVVVDDLTEDQIKAYRLIDNKSAEYSSWDKDLLQLELDNPVFDEMSFDYDFDGSARKKKTWSETTKKCDLKPLMRSYRVANHQCMCFFKAGKNGISIRDIKKPEFVDLFQENLIVYIEETFGTNLANGGWCLITTPRRRHSEDFHFATAICRGAGRRLIIPFYEDVITTTNHDRVHPHFNQEYEFPEKNVILYDDIITTGSTMQATREILDNIGCNVFEIAAIGNR